MARYELLFSTVLMLTSHTTAFHHNRRPIVTPNNGQSANPPFSPGNINEVAMFPPSSSNNLAPDSNDLADNPQGTPRSQLTPTLETSVNDTPPPDISIDTNRARSVTGTVAPPETTIIRVEFPSSITIFVNITNGQSIATPNIVGGTVQTTDTSTMDSNTVETLTSSSTDDPSTVEVTTATTSADLTTTAATSPSIDSTTTIEGSTVELSTVMNTDQDAEANTTDLTTGVPTAVSSVDTDSTTEITTTNSAVETTVADSTTEISTATNGAVETTIADSTTTVAEATTIATNVETNTSTESGSVAVTTVSDSSTEGMRQIQININLSDNTQNGNFGLTTQSSMENLGQLQNKMIYKQKCDEYYANSRASRETKVQVFIIGGTSSIPKEFPHMAALGYGKDPKKEWLCGGSLVSENYIVTAAHCVSSNNLGEVQVVRLGTTVLSTETLGSMDYKVIKRISHPNYRNDEQYNDIALLQLDRPVTFSEYVSPICLSPSVQSEALIATGWGKTEAAGDISPVLQKVDLENFPNKDCQDSYSTVSREQLPRGIVAQIQICAGSRSEQKDTCQGDSGGPLQVEDNGRMYLVGITSFGISCGKPGQPGVYTRVSYYIPWIEQIVWGSK